MLEGQKFNFLNMVMWHIKLMGMNSSPGFTENFYPTIKLVTLGWGQRVKPLDFFESMEICNGAPLNVFKLFLKKQQNLKMLSAANYRWCVIG